MLLRNVLFLGRLVKNESLIIPLHSWQSLLRPTVAAASSRHGFAKYSPDKYLHPVTNPVELDEIVNDEEERERLQFCNVHPTHPYQTLSIFYHPRVIKLCNYVMKEGNRALARKLVEQSFEFIKKTQLAAYHAATSDEEREQIECDPLKVFLTAVENCRPQLDVMPVRKGGITYQVPVPMTETHSYFVAMRWLVHAGRDRKHRTIHFPENFARELVDAHYNKGRVIQQKVDLHKQCENNRAYAHYRWG